MAIHSQVSDGVCSFVARDSIFISVPSNDSRMRKRLSPLQFHNPNNIY